MSYVKLRPSTNIGNILNFLSVCLRIENIYPVAVQNVFLSGVALRNRTHFLAGIKICVIDQDSHLLQDCSCIVLCSLFSKTPELLAPVIKMLKKACV